MWMTLASYSRCQKLKQFKNNLEGSAVGKTHIQCRTNVLNFVTLVPLHYFNIGALNITVYPSRTSLHFNNGLKFILGSFLLKLIRYFIIALTLTKS